MFGDTVLVREFGGKPIVCKDWEVTSDRVYVCTKETFDILKRLNGKPFPDNRFPIAFPREYVYRYNPKVDLTKIVWSKLTVYEN